MKKDLEFLKNKIVAHRGYHDINIGIPENSIPAFKRAIEKNYLIEFDLHLLKDGNVVVFHDDNLKRMTGLDSPIKDKTYKELQNLNLLNTSEHIPLFSDILKLINGKVPIIIELKFDNKCGLLEDKVLNTLKDYKGKYAIKSFNPLTVNYLRKKAPNVIRGQLSSDFKTDNINILKKKFMQSMLYNIITKPDFISYDIRALPSKRLKKLRKNKLIMVWTIKDKTSFIVAQNNCDTFIMENIEDIIETKNSQNIYPNKSGDSSRKIKRNIKNKKDGNK